MPNHNLVQKIDNMPTALKTALHHQEQALSVITAANHTASLLTLLAILLGIALVSMIAFYVSRFFVLRFAEKISIKFHSPWLESAFHCHLFHRLCYFIPPIIIYSSINLISLAEASYITTLIKLVRMLLTIYMIFLGTLTLSAICNCIEMRFQHIKLARHYSLKSYFQVTKIILYSIATILSISILMNKSPMYLLTGLGAMTAVLILIFRDSILGFVTSIQLSTNDIVRIGDWIEIPAFGANGKITDISLNTIKVRNFDNTIITIPSYAILNNGVKNWRGMLESGGRRIKRAFYLDPISIKFCERALIERLSQIPLLKQHQSDYVKRMTLSENDLAIAKLIQADEHCVTNLSLLRFYLEVYLRHHPKIHPDMSIIVKELDPTDHGLPIELYFFSVELESTEYEKIQADIFDYIYAILPLFELTPYHG